MTNCGTIKKWISNLGNLPPRCNLHFTDLCTHLTWAHWEMLRPTSNIRLALDIPSGWVKNIPQRRYSRRDRSPPQRRFPPPDRTPQTIFTSLISKQSNLRLLPNLKTNDSRKNKIATFTTRDYELCKIKMRYGGGFRCRFFLSGVENFLFRFPFEFGGASNEILCARNVWKLLFCE